MYRLLAASHECHITGGLEEEMASFRRWQGKKKLPD
jgi:hypothetical protein